MYMSAYVSPLISWSFVCLFVVVVCCVQGLLEELQVVRSERDKAVNGCKTLKQTVTALETEKTQLFSQVRSY